MKINSKEYIEWINSKVSKDKYITNLSMTTALDSNDDIANRERLQYFYSMVKNYADKNYIAPYTKNGYECSFIVEFPNNTCEIGEKRDFECFHYVIKAPEIDNPMNIYDIINNEKTQRAAEIDAKINYITDIIYSIKDSGVELETVKEILNNNIQKREINLSKGQARLRRK